MALVFSKMCKVRNRKCIDKVHLKTYTPVCALLASMFTSACFYLFIFFFLMWLDLSLNVEPL